MSFILLEVMQAINQSTRAAPIQYLLISSLLKNLNFEYSEIYTMLKILTILLNLLIQACDPLATVGVAWVTCLPRMSEF